MSVGLAVLFVLLVAAPVSAEIVVPPGFTTEVYVSGQGFDPSADRGVRGIPATGTLGFDSAGTLYLAKVGARFRSGEAEDLAPIYRIPAGGARLSPETEARYFYGPPLSNAQIGGVRGADVFVTTYDRDRRLGALYRLKDGRARLFAGGTPPPGSPPLLRQPEGLAFDASGNVYVADREQGIVVRLDSTGKPREPYYAGVTRARVVAFDEDGHLWIGGDGTADTPFQDGAGQLWRVTPGGRPSLVLEGPLPAGISVGPGGALFLAQRRTGQVIVVTPEGRRLDFVSSTEGTVLRSLAFAPITPETRRAGIAGDLFLIAVQRQVWMINEVIRVSGPFDEFLRRERRATPPQ